jgi:hypothetical protein
MPDENQARFNNYGHFRVEAVFLDRVFIVYKPTGLTAGGAHKEPEILNLLKVVDFMVEPRNGATLVLREQNTSQELTLGYVPRRVFGYPIYMSVPAKPSITYGAPA